MGTLLAAKVRQMVLFLGHRYFLLQLVVPDVIVRLRRMFPTVRIRPTVPVGDELLDSNGASAVRFTNPGIVISTRGNETTPNQSSAYSQW